MQSALDGGAVCSKSFKDGLAADNWTPGMGMYPLTDELPFRRRYPNPCTTGCVGRNDAPVAAE